GFLISSLDQEIEKSRKGGESSMLEEDCVNTLKQKLVTIVETRARAGQLLDNPRLPSTLYMWREWGPEQNAKTWVSSVIQTDDGLKRFLCQFASYSITHGYKDTVGQKHLRLNPQLIAPFVGDIAHVAARVEALLGTTQGDEKEKQVLAQFKKE